MKHVRVQPGADLETFRTVLRHLISENVPPRDVVWDTSAGLFGKENVGEAPPVALPRRAAQRIQLIICHKDAEKHALLYQLAWRIHRGETALLDIASDPLVHRLHGMEKSVRRDIHKMHAFLRFRRAETAGGEHFVSWFEPDHFILEAAAPFFVDRFTSMRWSILTPLGSVHWDRVRLTFGPAACRGDAPDADPLEAGWRKYYESTFNPARLNPAAMRGHMAKKYWKNMPETRAIAEMVRLAPARVEHMIAQQLAVPKKRDPQKAVTAMAGAAPQTLAALNELIAASPPMVQGGVRAVLGEGPPSPDLAFVGEQPGDQEDLQGRPFVGPAGRLLDRALEQAGIVRAKTYVTNAVKHFKFEQRGKHRLHAKPNAGEVKHYRWWLEKELDFVRPRLVVALGATAAMALAGKPVSVSANRGPRILGGRPSFVTIHPSFLLRMPAQDQEQAWKAFVEDLIQARQSVDVRAA